MAKHTSPVPPSPAAFHAGEGNAHWRVQDPLMVQWVLHLPPELLGVPGQQAAQPCDGILPDALAVVADLPQQLLLARLHMGGFGESCALMRELPHLYTPVSFDMAGVQRAVLAFPPLV